VQFSVCLTEGEEIAAAGSLEDNVLKCIAVSRSHQNEGLAAVVVTELVKEAARNNRYHLFLFTKSENEELFSSLGFYSIAKTDMALLMENRKQGIQDYVSALEKIPPKREPEAALGSAVQPIGAIVANCNPFTRGHQYLIEYAAGQCRVLHVFVVSENKSALTADVRLDLVRQGTAHLSNVLVHPTGPYMISAATFPDYFIKDTVSPLEVNTDLDLSIFAEGIALPLGIGCRFVGEEPLDPVTAMYNRQMKEILPSYGIRVREIPRMEKRGAPISASRVREFLAAGDLPALQELVPSTTYEYLRHNIV
jgi:[citrate (pro-3S)-lyase] ligase